MSSFLHKSLCSAIALLSVAILPVEGAPIFRSDFESGNGQNFLQIGENHFSFEFEKDTGSDDSQWFYFEVKAAKGETLTFDLLGVNDTNVPGHWKSAVPVVSNDGGTTWARLTTKPERLEDAFRFTHTLEADTVRFAFHDPYTLTMIEADIARWSTHPAATLRSIGNSVEGRPIQLLSITDSSVPAAEKQGVWVTARQHSAEVTSSFTLAGFVDALLAEDETGRALRKRFHVHIVPAANPDGIALGNYRDNALGMNLNRLWDGSATLETAPEMVHIRREIRAWVDAGNNYSFYIDLHSTSGDEPHFAFHNNTKNTTPEYAAELQRFLDLVEKHCPHFSAATGLSSSMDRRFSDDSNWKEYGVKAWIFEGAYNNQNHGATPEAFMTPETHRAVGAAIARALVEF